MAYPPAFRAEAARLVADVGLQEASERLDVPVSTLQHMALLQNVTSTTLARSSERAAQRYEAIAANALAITEQATVAASEFIAKARRADESKDALTWTMAATRLMDTIAKMAPAHRPDPEDWRTQLDRDNVVDAEVVPALAPVAVPVDLFD